MTVSRWERFQSLWQAVRAGVTETRYASARNLLLAQSPEFSQVWSRVDAVPGWLKDINALALYETIKRTRPQTIVEIGSYLGRSTALFALATRALDLEARVVAIDPHTGDRNQLAALGAEELPTFALFRSHCEALGILDVVEPVVMTSVDAARRWDGTPVDLLFVDGWHSFDAVVADGTAWLKYLSPSGVVFFDDCLGAEVRAGVQELERRGLMSIWAMVFGQYVGGRSSRPPPELEELVFIAQHRVRRWLKVPAQRQTVSTPV